MANQRINPFVVLNIEADATDEQIKKKYRDLLKKFHPDLNNNSLESQEQTELITKAYKMLAHTTIDDRKYMFRQLTANLAGQRKLKKIVKPSPTDGQSTDDSNLTKRELLRKVWCQARLKRKRDWAESTLNNAEHLDNDTKKKSKYSKATSATSSSKVASKSATKNKTQAQPKQQESQQPKQATDSKPHLKEQQSTPQPSKQREQVATMEQTATTINTTNVAQNIDSIQQHGNSIDNTANTTQNISTYDSKQQSTVDTATLHKDTISVPTIDWAKVAATVAPQHYTATHDEQLNKNKVNDTTAVSTSKTYTTNSDKEYWLDIPQQFLDKLPKSRYNIDLSIDDLQRIFNKVNMLPLQKRDKIWAVGYDALTMTLFVKIKNAKIIAHTHVPVAIYVNLRNSPKPIAYWRADIKKQYTRTEWKI